MQLFTLQDLTEYVLIKDHGCWDTV